MPVFLLDKQTILKFCLPLAVATGFMWLQNTGYRFVVGGVWGVTELGILVVGLGISAQLWAIVESLAMQFLGPYLYRHITDSKSDVQYGQALSDYMNSLVPVYAVFAGFNAVCGTAVLNVLTDERYHVAAPFVIFGAMIEFAGQQRTYGRRQLK
jgi:O-antigen/teichoic acid export membrane protein